MRVTGLTYCDPGMTYRVQVMDFKEYVKGVLPNEWYPKWHDESLKAGAIAVKMFAWSMSETRGYVWDCTWSQVYDSSKRTPRTDAAVDYTWDWVFVDDGIVKTYYNANKYGCYDRGDNCMSQVGSQALALQGHNWGSILNEYYTGTLTNSIITLINPVYVRNGVYYK